MSAPAIMEVVNTTATTQLDPITALATLDGCYQAMEKPAQVCRSLNMVYILFKAHRHIRYQ